MLNSLKLAKITIQLEGYFPELKKGGLYGARLIAKSERINKNSIIVSIETSSELPGASQARGQ
ncbi:MAG: hypothetical protein Ct9H90mP2_10520 [Dehalococcoidia bacterium]|nr:MAG: hypothetical protein Ct9H90mP2_10520 [Dehalococcoidia bacterium]